MNNKKTIIILILVLTIGIVGLTIAYFSNTTSIDNLFSTNPYGTTVVEEFISPDNWLPGTTTEKTITVTNTGSVDEAVRISYTEEWKAKDGTILSGLIDSNGILTNNTENSERAAIINFSNPDDWNYSNGYYYYNYRLAPHETTSSLIDSVTFNSKVKSDSNCTTETNGSTKTVTCNSTNAGYDGATYKLTFNIETVQYNKYKEAWGVDIALAENRQLYCDAFEVGEVVDYKGSEYYVLKDSSTEDDYVTLLKKDPLTADEVNTYSTDYVSQNGEYPYFESDTCNENNQTGCSTNYDTSSVKKIIDGWSSSFSDDLVSIDGYKTRLIVIKEAVDNFYYDFRDVGTSGDNYYRFTSSTPIWFYDIESINDFWTMSSYQDSNVKIYKHQYRYTGQMNSIFETDRIFEKHAIRPVINLKKSAIESGCHVDNNYYNYSSYSIGETINYNNSNYCVINSSKLSEDYVTLIKSDPLTYDELVIHNNGYEVGRDNEDNNVGTISYYKSNDCYYNSDHDKNTTGCSSDYDTSNIKVVIDNWSNTFNDELKEINGYKARLITYDEIMGIGYTNVMHGTQFYLEESYGTKCSGFKTWYNGGHIVPTVSRDTYVSQLSPVRPVINLKKCAIDNTCE